MKERIQRIVFIWTYGLTLLVPVFGQVSGAKEEALSSSKMGETAAPQEVITVEAAAENLVRAAYAKLTRYNKAFLLVDKRRDMLLPIEEAYLRFELTNFKVGPIQEILNLPYDQVRSMTSEEVHLSRLVTTHNDADPHIAYSARWEKVQYAAGFNPKWTINVLLSHDPASYHDVGMYARFDVVLKFNGKVKSYTALTLFHNPYGVVENLKPIFWDPMVGGTGELADLWYERRPAVGEPSQADPIGREKPVSLSSGGVSGVSRLLPSTSSPAPNRILPNVVTSTGSTTPTLGPVVSSTVEDRLEHSQGAHGERIDFQGSCEAPMLTQQVCKVNFYFIYTYENGTVTNLLYRHRMRDDKVFGTSTGPRGTPITCVSGHGLAIKNCIGECTFAASLTGAGLTMQMTGGDVWRGEVVHGHTCNIPPPREGGGGCNQSIQIVKESLKTPRPNLVNPYCCDAVEQSACINGGGEWTDSTCSCYSPIVIDVAGNGFDLTNATDGVLFDLNALGTPELISWTARDSDDGFLVMDRNGNGVIDNGRELFGSVTPQPYLAPGETKNGFRALAVFDAAENGGNGDGRIDENDAVFSSLKLWQDRNHNGFSDAGELQNLTASDIRVIELKYRESRQQDENGNWFRYRAKVNDVQGGEVGRWAWDVFLQRPH